MRIALHEQARTTPAVRAEIAQSKDPIRVLARRYNVTEANLRKWKSRTEFNDRPHTAQRLQTTLTPAGVPFRAGPLPAPPWRRLPP